MKYQIVIAGIGGQGAVFLVKLLSIASAQKSLKALGTENHGMSQRGGSVSCFVKIGDFQAPAIDEASANLLIALDGDEALRYIHYLSPKGKLIVNSHTPLDLSCDKFIINAYKKAQNKEFPINALNVFMLGIVLAKANDFPFSKDEIKSALHTMNAKLASQNIAVLDLAIKVSNEQE